MSKLSAASPQYRTCKCFFQLISSSIINLPFTNFKRIAVNLVFNLVSSSDFKVADHLNFARDTDQRKIFALKNFEMKTRRDESSASGNHGKEI